MDLWSMLEERIKLHGVRVDERLNLLNELKLDHESGGMSVAERKESLMLSVGNAANRLRETLRA